MDPQSDADRDAASVTKSERPKAGLSRFQTFAHPALADGRLYLRDADLLFCYDVRAK